MGDVRRLDRCYRCRKVFAARAGERYCPECRRELARERNRKRLGISGFSTSAWAPLITVVLATLAGGFLPTRYGALLGGLVGIIAVWYGTSAK